MPSSFQHCLEPVNTFSIEWFSEARPFRRLSNILFPSILLWKYLGYDTHLFFQNVLNLMHISEVQGKMQKKSFVFDIIALQVVA